MYYKNRNVRKMLALARISDAVAAGGGGGSGCKCANQPLPRPPPPPAHRFASAMMLVGPF